jgi:hypothetical protein
MATFYSKDNSLKRKKGTIPRKVACGGKKIQKNLKYEAGKEEKPGH